MIAGLAFLASALALAMASRRGGVALLPRAEAARAPTWRGLLGAAVAVPTRYGVAVLAAANFVMVGVMAVAPVHLMAHGRDLEMVGTAISLHVAGMFAPSPISGWLADRVGPIAVAAIGCGLALVAGVGGAIADLRGASTVLALVILGVGWNFGVVGGSALIVRSVDPSLRTSVEGIGEVAMGVAAAVAAPLAGVIIAIGEDLGLVFVFASPRSRCCSTRTCRGRGSGARCSCSRSSGGRGRRSSGRPTLTIRTTRPCGACSSSR